MKYFITEDIYIVEDNERSVQTEEVVAEPKPQYNTHKTEDTKKSGTCVILGDLSQQNHETLQKILSAINVSNPEFADTVDLASGHAQYLIFGDYEVMDKYIAHEKNGIKWLISDELDALDANLELKKKLWPQLQRVFLSNK